MIRDKDKVADELRRRVLLGCDPYYSYESACDNDTDWLVLSQEEFQRIFDEAKRERERTHRSQ